MKPTVKAFFDKGTSTLTYIVYDEQSRDALVIDPVWDYDQAASKVSTHSVEIVLSFLKEKALRLHYILETHAHADHLSGAQLVKKAHPNAKIGIGSKIKVVQTVFKELYHLAPTFKTDGSQFDFLLEEGEVLKVGTLSVQVLFTPGHTPACASYVIGDAVFTGDALFLPDSGTGRCDFPKGSAEELYNSIHGKLYKLPDTTRVFVGHDYQPNGRQVQWESTIGEEKEKNIQLTAQTTKESFLEFRKKRDASLSAPKLLLPSLQVNIDAGHLPSPESNGMRYLKIPVT